MCGELFFVLGVYGVGSFVFGFVVRFCFLEISFRSISLMGGEGLFRWICL